MTLEELYNSDYIFLIFIFTKFVFSVFNQLTIMELCIIQKAIFPFVSH